MLSPGWQKNKRTNLERPGTYTFNQVARYVKNLEGHAIVRSRPAPGKRVDNMRWKEERPREVKLTCSNPPRRNS
jgi:hypothetical protein